MKLPVTSCPQLWMFSLYCISQPTKNVEVVLLFNSLAWRGVLMMDNTFPIKKHSNMVLQQLCPTFLGGNQATSIGRLGLHFHIIAVDPPIISGYDLEEIWFLDSGLNQIISNCSMMFLLLWQQKLWNERQHNMFYAKVLCQNLGQQFLESPDQLLVFALSVSDFCSLPLVHIQHSQVFLLQAFQNVYHFQQILNHL